MLTEAYKNVHKSSRIARGNIDKKKPRKSNQGLLGKTTGRITEKDPEKIPE